MIIVAYVVIIILVIAHAFAIVSIKEEEDGYISKNNRTYLLVLFMIFQGYFIYSAFFKYPETETYEQKIACKDLYYERCGEITKRVIETHEYKGSKIHDYCIYVNFNPKQNVAERIEVSKQIYDKKIEKDRVCFYEETDYMTYWIILNVILGIISIVGFVLCIIYAVNED